MESDGYALESAGNRGVCILGGDGLFGTEESGTISESVVEVVVSSILFDLFLCFLGFLLDASLSLKKIVFSAPCGTKHCLLSAPFFF
jgi:hypothetical protein